MIACDFRGLPQACSRRTHPNDEPCFPQPWRGDRQTASSSLFHKHGSMSMVQRYRKSCWTAPLIDPITLDGEGLALCKSSVASGLVGLGRAQLPHHLQAKGSDMLLGRYSSRTFCEDMSAVRTFPNNLSLRQTLLAHHPHTNKPAKTKAVSTIRISRTAMRRLPNREYRMRPVSRDRFPLLPPAIQHPHLTTLRLPSDTLRLLSLPTSHPGIRCFRPGGVLKIQVT